MELRLLGRKPPRRTVFGLSPGFDGLVGPLAFFLDSRESHGLGDLVLSALLRASGTPVEPPPRRVTDVRLAPGGLLRVETERSLIWVAVGALPEGAEAPPDRRPSWRSPSLTFWSSCGVFCRVICAGPTSSGGPRWPIG